LFMFFFSSRRRHTRCLSDWSSDVCSSDLSSRMRPVNGKPITGRILDEFHVGTRGPAELVVRRLSYPAASLNQPEARLVVRDRERSEERRVGKGWTSGWAPAT